MSDLNYDLIVIGAGPGGYVAAIRANQLGLKTAVIEKEAPGGVCLNWGCIPSKSLISQAQKYSYIGDLKKMGIKFDLSEFNYANVYKKSRIAAMKLSKGVEFLLKKNEIELIKGTAKITDPNMVTVDNDKMYSAKFILVATGSRPKVIKGFEFDEKDILSSTGALSLKVSGVSPSGTGIRRLRGSVQLNPDCWPASVSGTTCNGSMPRPSGALNVS